MAQKSGGTFSPKYGSSFWFDPLLPRIQLIFFSLNGLYLFSPVYSSFRMVCTYSHPDTHIQLSPWPMILLESLIRNPHFIDNLVNQVILVDHFFTAGKVWWFQLSIPLSIKTKHQICMFLVSEVSFLILFSWLEIQVKLISCIFWQDYLVTGKKNNIGSNLVEAPAFETHLNRIEGRW